MKFSLGILALFLTVIYLKENEASSFQVSFDQRPEQKINSTSKQIQGAVADINKVFDEVVSDSGDSLSGNRIEGLPNITDLRYKFDNWEIRRKLQKITLLNLGNLEMYFI